MAAPTQQFKTTSSGKPNAPQKRRKYAAGTGTPRQRAIMLGVAALCVAAAFLIPGPAAPDPNTAGVEEAVEQPAPPAPPVRTSAYVPPIPSGASPGRQSRDPNFPPLLEAAAFPPSTPEEVDKRIQLLEKYYSNSNPKEREAAYKATVALGKELTARLPKLIETSAATPLSYFALAARELNAVEAVPALIARLEAKDKPRVAQFEIFSALASFDDPKARAYVLEEMKNHKILRPSEIWEALGTKMDEAQIELAFKAITDGGPDCLLAADALGRYANTYEKASPLSQRIQPLLGAAKGDAKVALVQALAGMEASVAANSLSGLSFDLDPKIRAAALGGLAKIPQQQNLAISSFRREQDPGVKSAILKGFITTPNKAMIPDLIPLLNQQDYKALAHAALIAVNKGKDRGTHDFDWYDLVKKNQTELPPIEVDQD